VLKGPDEGKSRLPIFDKKEGKVGFGQTISLKGAVEGVLEGGSSGRRTLLCLYGGTQEKSPLHRKRDGKQQIFLMGSATRKEVRAGKKYTKKLNVRVTGVKPSNYTTGQRGGAQGAKTGAVSSSGHGVSWTRSDQPCERVCEREGWQGWTPGQAARKKGNQLWKSFLGRGSRGSGKLK